LPQSVLVLNEEGKVGVKALDEQNKVRFYPIKIVDEEADKIWLTGLPTELRVITLGHVYINVGDELKIDQETTVQ
jgi:multidrug efflux system membrane fusion protein